MLADLRGRVEIRVLLLAIVPGFAGRLVRKSSGRFWRAEFCHSRGWSCSRSTRGTGIGWGRTCRRLDVPFREGEGGVELDRVLIPGKLSAQRPSGRIMESLRVAVVPEEYGRIRPATAMRCSLAVLSRWAGRRLPSQDRCAWREPGGQRRRSSGGRRRGVGAWHAGKSAPFTGERALLGDGTAGSPGIPAGSRTATRGDSRRSSRAARAIWSCSIRRALS